MINFLFAAPYHGTGGMLSVVKSHREAIILPTFLNAGRELGYNVIVQNLPDLLGK